MTPRTPSSADAQIRLAEAIDGLSQRLQVLQEAIDDIRTEINFAVTNAKPFIMPRVLPRDPTGPRWNERLAALSPTNGDIAQEYIVCTECTTTLPLGEAVRAGWQEVDSDGRDIFGLCPSCDQAELSEESAKEPKETPQPTPLISHPPLQDRIDDHERWKAEVRDPAQKASEGVRKIAVPGAEADYEIAQLPTGKWAVTVRTAYTKGDMSGSSSPWFERDTRDECVQAFLEHARRHFGHSNITDKQRDAQRMMLKRLASDGLFEWQEPDPEQKAKPEYLPA